MEVSREDDTLAGSVEPQAGIHTRLDRQAAWERLFPGMPSPEPVRIGRFAVLGRIGAGGMGVVFAAYDEQLDRKIALKLLHAGSSAGDPRLLREAQAMAKVSHPNVAVVHEVGEHGGEVFVAMEFVVGRTLREWLRERERPWREIVAMFVQAGRGLAAAHASGLVHRDFKPDNVLVGDDGRARVVDFGLARPLAVAEPDRGESPTEATDRSRATGVAGTPAYMAPEQLEGRKADARADQFAFCVSLWEALFGERPFHGDTVPELMTRVLEGRIRDVPEHATVPDWVIAAVRHGLAPDPAARWPSIEQLLAALLADPTRRRRRAIAIAGTVAVAVAGVVGWSAMRAAERRACDVEAGAAAAELDAIDRSQTRDAFAATGSSHAADAWQRTEPLLDAFAQAWQAERADVCVRARVDGEIDPEVLALAAACLDEQRAELAALVELVRAPAADVAARMTQAAAGLPRPVSCRDETRLRQRPRLPDDPDARASIASVREELAATRVLEGAGRMAEGDELAQATLAEADAVDWEPLRAEALARVGAMEYRMNRLDDATRTLEQAYLSAGGVAHDDAAADAATALVRAHGAAGRLDLAELWARIARMILRRLGDEGSLRESTVVGELATLQQQGGRLQPAIELHRESLAIREAVLGPEHPAVAVPLNNMAVAFLNLGEYAEAQPLLERALAIRESTLGSAHPEVGRTLHNLGLVASGHGRQAEAVTLLHRALAIVLPTVGPRSRELGAIADDLAGVYNQMGHYDVAVYFHEQGLAAYAASLGESHPSYGIVLGNLGSTYHAAGRHDLAGDLLARSLEVLERTLGPDDFRVTLALSNLGNTRVEQGRFDEGLALQQRALERATKLGADPSFLSDIQAKIALVHHERRNWDEALAGYEQALATIERADAPTPSVRVATLIGIAKVQLERQRPDLAVFPAGRGILPCILGELGGTWCDDALQTFEKTIASATASAQPPARKRPSHGR